MDGTTRTRTRGKPGRKVHDEAAWVVQIKGRVVAMIRLACNGDGAAHIRQVRLDPDWQHTSLLRHLLRRVQQFCLRRGLSRIVVEPGGAPAWARRVIDHLR